MIVSQCLLVQITVHKSSSITARSTTHIRSERSLNDPTLIEAYRTLLDNKITLANRSQEVMSIPFIPIRCEFVTTRFVHHYVYYVRVYLLATKVFIGKLLATGGAPGDHSMVKKMHPN